MGTETQGCYFLWVPLELSLHKAPRKEGQTCVLGFMAQTALALLTCICSPLNVRLDVAMFSTSLSNPGGYVPVTQTLYAQLLFENGG